MSSTNSSSDSELRQQQRQADREAAKSMVLKLIEQTSDQTFSAKELLTQYPELEQYPSCVIDLAYEEWCRLREQGANVQVTQFVQEFGAVEQSLYRVIECDQVLHDHPSLIEHVPEERWPAAGDEFAKFRLLEQIGRGALSRVFIAEQPDLGNRQVIVKVCVRGEREAGLLGKLECPGIAPVHSIDTDSEIGLTAICMPYLTRVTMHHLAERLCNSTDFAKCTGAGIRAEVRQLNGSQDSSPETEQGSDVRVAAGSLTIQDDDLIGTAILKWGIQLANALGHAHSKDILHCDVKPGNVLVMEDLSASLLDFNLATTADDAIRLAGGTMPYMASEQLWLLIGNEATTDLPFRINEPLSERTDIYGLCATIWHLATGEPPFGVAADFPTRTESSLALLKRQAAGVTKERIERIEQTLPKPAVQVLLKGLSLRPDERYVSTQELAGALRATVPKLFRRSRRMAIGIILMAVGAAVFGIEPVRHLFQPEIVAIRKAHERISLGDLAGAQQLVTPFAGSSPECQFIELYCRTCVLPCMIYAKKGELGTPLQVERTTQWDNIVQEWAAVRDAGVFSAEASLNLAFVFLEYGNISQFEMAEQQFHRAAEAPLTTARSERTLALLQFVKPETTVEPGDLPAAWEDVRASGTRGEFLVFLTALSLQLSADISPEMETVLLDVIRSAEKGTVNRAEPESFKILLATKFVAKNGALRGRLYRVTHRAPEHGPETDPNFNRLRDVLLLPGASN